MKNIKWHFSDFFKGLFACSYCGCEKASTFPFLIGWKKIVDPADLDHKYWYCKEHVKDAKMRTKVQCQWRETVSTRCSETVYLAEDFSEWGFENNRLLGTLWYCPQHKQQGYDFQKNIKWGY